MSLCEVTPGASAESALVKTDSCENFAEQMTSSLEEIKLSNSVITKENNENCNNIDLDNYEDNGVSGNAVAQDDDYVRSQEWLDKKKHIFVLSSAGKPIYSR